MSTYIKLEDVQKIYGKIRYPSDEILDFMDDIYSLPSIDFEEMIKEKLKMCKAQASDSERHFGGMVVCEQILSSLPK